MDGYNEMDDMGTGYEEACERKYEQMVDAQVREIVEACACEVAGTQEAADALLAGFCDACGWHDGEMAYACDGCARPMARPAASCSRC